jgi:formylglycine-generating enzyme required for sulfatase activity
MTGQDQNKAAAVRARGSIIGSIIDAAVNVYQTERTISENRERDDQQRKFEKELEELRHRNQQQLQEEDFAHQKQLQEEDFARQKQLQEEDFARQKQLQEELADYNRQTQLKIAAEQRKIALESVEANKLFENWPLRNVPSMFLKSRSDNTPIPLHIIPVPPVVDFDQFTTNAEESLTIEKYLAEGLRQFLHKNYSLNSKIRPVELLDGAWDSNRYHGGSSIKALFSMLQSEPVLILESEIDGDDLNFRLGYWGLAQENYSYAPVISRLPFWEIIYESAKNRAKEWKINRDKILALGQDPEAINELDTYNLAILEQEAALEEQGIDISNFPSRYRVDRRDFKAFAEFLVTCNCLVAGWIADAHHLIQGNITPLLPQLLPEWVGDAPEEVVQSIQTGYSNIYESLEKERLEVMPELRLEFAYTLKDLPDKSWAKTQVDNSIKSWLKLRGIGSEQEINLLETIQPLLMSPEDLSYLEKVRECLTAIGDEATLSRIQAFLYARETTLNDAEKHYQSALACTQQGDYLGAIAALDQAIRLNPYEPKFQNFRQQVPKNIDTYTFDVITVNSEGEEVKREQGEAQYFSEDLGNGVTLKMVDICGGRFLMGAPNTEEGSSDHERPQHEVTIQPFFMGKYPVTQAQWRAIADRTDLRVEHYLDPAPTTHKNDIFAFFLEDDYPVEQVTWYEAKEFCGRLSKLTGREYRLPSEAEWEYACRAGTTTPFHFGETITTDLVNEEEKTTPVGNFPPNAFGLYDLHGNVGEWCGDDWEDNYQIPRTQEYHESDLKIEKVIRGGSWDDPPRSCRSGIRFGYSSVTKMIYLGFRVVCDHPKTL